MSLYHIVASTNDLTNKLKAYNPKTKIFKLTTTLDSPNGKTILTSSFHLTVHIVYTLKTFIQLYFFDLVLLFL